MEIWLFQYTRICARSIGKLYEDSKVEKKIIACVLTDRERGTLSKKLADVNKKEERVRTWTKLSLHPLWMVPYRYR